ncbi:MAG: hypothetical protein HGA50_12975 [Deltaproteobacteria bacterium]|nr:hypothetical protein [Deltaproteobacteria bacterium]
MNQVSPHDNNDPPWWYFFVSLLFLCFAGYLYHYFTDFEATGGTRRINWFISLAYELGGKWTLVGIVVLAASGCAYLGFEEMKSWKQGDGKK